MLKFVSGFKRNKPPKVRTKGVQKKKRALTPPPELLEDALYNAIMYKYICF